MSSLTLRRDARILVCDGKSALFLKNNGPPGHEAFEVESSARQELPAHNSDMGSDRPGRTQNRSGPSSGVEAADWHAEQEKAFIMETLRGFTALCAQSPKAQIVFVAPPRALATIRKSADQGLLSRCVAQIDKDLTKHPVAEIQKIVLG